MYHIFFHLSIGGHLGCFYVLAVVSNAAVNVGIKHLNVRSEMLIRNFKMLSTDRDKIIANTYWSLLSSGHSPKGFTWINSFTTQNPVR